MEFPYTLKAGDKVIWNDPDFYQLQLEVIKTITFKHEGTDDAEAFITTNYDREIQCPVCELESFQKSYAQTVFKTLEEILEERRYDDVRFYDWWRDITDEWNNSLDKLDIRNIVTDMEFSMNPDYCTWPITLAAPYDMEELEETLKEIQSDYGEGCQFRKFAEFFVKAVRDSPLTRVQGTIEVERSSGGYRQKYYCDTHSLSQLYDPETEERIATDTHREIDRLAQEIAEELSDLLFEELQATYDYLTSDEHLFDSFINNENFGWEEVPS